MRDERVSEAYKIACAAILEHGEGVASLATLPGVADYGEVTVRVGTGWDRPARWALVPDGGEPSVSVRGVKAWTVEALVAWMETP